MKSRIFANLRLRLMLLVLLAVIPMCALVLYTNLQDRRAATVRVQADALRLAHLAADGQLRIIEETHHLLIALAQVQELQTGSAPMCSAFLSRLLEQYSLYANLGVVEANGDLFCSAVPISGPVNFADRAWYRRVSETHDFVVADYLVGRIVGRSILVLVYPIVGQDGELQRIVFASLDLAWLNDFAGEARLPPGATVTVIDRNATILVRSPESERWVGTDGRSNAVFRTVLEREGGVTQGFGLEGVRRLFGYTSLRTETSDPDPSAYVIVGIPEGIAYAEVNRGLAQDLGGLGVVALLGLAAAWVSSDLFILRSVNHLLQATRRLSAGDLRARTNLLHDEGQIGRLARAFDGMATALQARQAEADRLQAELRLDESRLEAALRLSQMADVSQARLVSFALEEAVHLTQSKLGFLALVNHGGAAPLLYIWPGSGGTDGQVSGFEAAAPPADEVALWPAAVHRYLSAADPQPDTSPWRADLCRSISVPVFAGEHIVAVAGVANKEEDYRDSDKRQLTLLMGGVWSILERHRSEEALWQAKRVIEHSPVVLFLSRVVEREGWPTEFVSDNVRRFGYLPEEFLSGRIVYDDIIFPEDRDHVIREMRDRLGRGETSLNLEYRILTRNGLPRWVADHVSIIRGAEGESSYCESAMVDVTDRKTLEESLRQAQKMETIGQLAGGVAHDFNNLLTAIIGYAGLARETLSPGDPVREDIEQVLKAADRAAGLTRRLLAFSRRQVIAPRITNLSELILDMDKMLRRLIGEDIEFVTMPAPDLWPVSVDPGQIEQALVNLVVNARDAMPHGGTLMLSTQNVTLDADSSGRHAGILAGDYVNITVSDTGLGMSEEVKAHLFEPFFTTKGVGKGTGLGLAMVYGIVEQHRGSIRVESEPGLGTQVDIYLPGMVEQEGEKPPQRDQARGLPQGHETLLIVEDEPAVRRLAVRMARELGYSVLEAADGESALQVAQEHAGPIHLLLTDLIMPQMNGKDLAERMASLRDGIRVLYMSGYTDRVIADLGALGKGEAFLQKPFTADSLARRIREVLERL